MGKEIEPWEYMKFEPWCIHKSAINMEEFFDLGEVMGQNTDKIFEAYEASHFVAIDIIMSMIESVGD